MRQQKHIEISDLLKHAARMPSLFILDAQHSTPLLPRLIAVAIVAALILTTPGTTAWADAGDVPPASASDPKYIRKFGNEASFAGSNINTYNAIMNAAIGDALNIQAADAENRLGKQFAQIDSNANLTPQQQLAKTRLMASLAAHSVTPIMNGITVDPTRGTGALNPNSFSARAANAAYDLLVGNELTLNGQREQQQQVTFEMPKNLSDPILNETKLQSILYGDKDQGPVEPEHFSADYDPVDPAKKNTDEDKETKRNVGIIPATQAEIDGAIAILVNYRASLTFDQTRLARMMEQVKLIQDKKSEIASNETNIKFYSDEMSSPANRTNPNAIQSAVRMIQFYSDKNKALQSEIDQYQKQLGGANLSQVDALRNRIQQEEDGRDTMTQWLNQVQADLQPLIANGSIQAYDFTHAIDSKLHLSGPALLDSKNRTVTIDQAVSNKVTELESKKGENNRLSLDGAWNLARHTNVISSLSTAFANPSTLILSALWAVLDARQNGYFANKATVQEDEKLSSTLPYQMRLKGSVGAAQDNLTAAAQDNEAKMLEAYASHGWKEKQLLDRVQTEQTAKTALKTMSKVLADIKSLSSGDPGWRDKMVQIAQELGNKSFAQEMAKLRSSSLSIDDAVKLLSSQATDIIAARVGTELNASQKKYAAQNKALMDSQYAVQVAESDYKRTITGWKDADGWHAGLVSDALAGGADGRIALAILHNTGAQVFDPTTGALLDTENDSLRNAIGQNISKGYMGNSYADYTKRQFNTYGRSVNFVMAPVDAWNAALDGNDYRYQHFATSPNSNVAARATDAVLAGFNGVVSTSFGLMTDVAGHIGVGTAAVLAGEYFNFKDWVAAGLSQINNSETVQAFTGVDSKLVQRYFAPSGQGMIADPLLMTRTDEFGNKLGLNTGNDFLDNYLTRGREHELAAGRYTDSYMDVLDSLDLKKNASWLGADGLAALRAGNYATGLAKLASGVTLVAGQTYADMATFGEFNTMISALKWEGSLVGKAIKTGMEYGFVKLPSYQFAYSIANDLTNVAKGIMTGNNENAGEGLVGLTGLFVGSAALQSKHMTDARVGSFLANPAKYLSTLALDMVPHFEEATPGKSTFVIGSIGNEAVKMGTQGAMTLFAGAVGAVGSGYAAEKIAQGYQQQAHQEITDWVYRGMPEIEKTDPGSSLPESHHDSDVFAYLRSLKTKIGDWARESLPQPVPELVPLAVGGDGRTNISVEAPMQLAGRPAEVETPNRDAGSAHGSPAVADAPDATGPPKTDSTAKPENNPAFARLANRITAPNFLERAAGARKLSANEVAKIAIDTSRLTAVLGIVQRDIRASQDQPDGEKAQPISHEEANAVLQYVKGKLVVKDGEVSLETEQGGVGHSLGKLDESPLLREALDGQKVGNRVVSKDDSTLRLSIHDIANQHQTQYSGVPEATQDHVDASKGLDAVAKGRLDLARFEGDPGAVRAATTNAIRSQIKVAEAEVKFIPVKAKTDFQKLDTEIAELKAKNPNPSQEISSQIKSLEKTRLEMDQDSRLKTIDKEILATDLHIQLASTRGESDAVHVQQGKELLAARQQIILEKAQNAVDEHTQALAALKPEWQEAKQWRDLLHEAVTGKPSASNALLEREADIAELSARVRTQSLHLEVAKSNRATPKNMLEAQANTLEAVKRQLAQKMAERDTLRNALAGNADGKMALSDKQSLVSDLQARLNEVGRKLSDAQISLKLEQKRDAVLKQQADIYANEHTLKTAQEELSLAHSENVISETDSSAAATIKAADQQHARLDQVDQRATAIQGQLEQIGQAKSKLTVKDNADQLKALQAQEMALHQELRSYRQGQEVWSQRQVDEALKTAQSTLANKEAKVPALIESAQAVELARKAVETQRVQANFEKEAATLSQKLIRAQMTSVTETAPAVDANSTTDSNEVKDLKDQLAALKIKRNTALQKIAADLTTSFAGASGTANRELKAWELERHVDALKAAGFEAGDPEILDALANAAVQRTFADHGIGTGFLDGFKAFWNESDFLKAEKTKVQDDAVLSAVNSYIPESIREDMAPLRALVEGREDSPFALTYVEPDGNARTDASFAAKLVLTLSDHGKSLAESDPAAYARLVELQQKLQIAVDRIADTLRDVQGVRDFKLLHMQVMNLLQAVATGRTFSIAPTGTGKTKVLTFGDAYLMKQIYGDRMGKVTVAMPDVNLMDQALKDVQALYEKVGWKVARLTGEDFANGTALQKVRDADVVFTPRQTLQELHMEAFVNGEARGIKGQVYRMLFEKGLLLQDEAHQLGKVDLIQGGNAKLLKLANEDTYKALVSVDRVFGKIYWDILKGSAALRDGKTPDQYSYQDFYHSYLKRYISKDGEFTDEFLEKVYAVHKAAMEKTTPEKILDQLREGTDGITNREKLALRAFAEAATAGHAVEGGYGIEKDAFGRIKSLRIVPISLGKEAPNMFFGDSWQAGARQIVGARVLAAKGIINLGGATSAEDLLQYAKSNGQAKRVGDIGPTSLFTFIVQFTGTPGEVMHREALTHGLYTPKDVGPDPTVKYSDKGLNKIRDGEYVKGLKTITDFGNYVAQEAAKRKWTVVAVESAKVNGFEVWELAQNEGLRDNHIVIVQRGPAVDVYENGQKIHEGLSSESVADFFKKGDAQKYYLGGRTLGPDGRVAVPADEFGNPRQGKGIVVVLDGPGSTGTDIQFRFMDVGSAIQSLKKLLDHKRLTADDIKNLKLDDATYDVVKNLVGKVGSLEEQMPIEARLNQLEVAETLSRMLQGRYVSDEMLTNTKHILKSWVNGEDAAYKDHAQALLDILDKKAENDQKVSFQNGLKSARETSGEHDIVAHLTPIAREMFRTVFADYLANGPKFITGTGSETNNRGGVQAPGRDRGLGSVAAFGYHDKAIVPIGEALAETAPEHLKTLNEKGQELNLDERYRGLSSNLTQMKFTELAFVVSNERVRLEKALAAAKAAGLWDGSLDERGLSGAADRVIANAQRQRLDSSVVESVKMAQRGLKEILDAQTEFERKAEEAQVTMGQKENSTAKASLQGDVLRLQADLKRVTKDRIKYLSQTSQDFLNRKNATTLKLEFNNKDGVTKEQLAEMSDAEVQNLLSGGEGRGFLGQSFESALVKLGQLHSSALEFKLKAQRSTPVTVAETKVEQAVEKMVQRQVSQAAAGSDAKPTFSDNDLMNLKRVVDRGARSWSGRLALSPAFALVAAAGNSQAAVQQALELAAHYKNPGKFPPPLVADPANDMMGSNSVLRQLQSTVKGVRQDYRETMANLGADEKWKPLKATYRALEQISFKSLSDNQRNTFLLMAYQEANGQSLNGTSMGPNLITAHLVEMIKRQVDRNPSAMKDEGLNAMRDAVSKKLDASGRPAADVAAVKAHVQDQIDDIQHVVSGAPASQRESGFGFKVQRAKTADGQDAVIMPAETIKDSDGVTRTTAASAIRMSQLADYAVRMKKKVFLVLPEGVYPSSDYAQMAIQVAQRANQRAGQPLVFVKFSDQKQALAHGTDVRADVPSTGFHPLSAIVRLFNRNRSATPNRGPIFELSKAYEAQENVASLKAQIVQMESGTGTEDPMMAQMIPYLKHQLPQAEAALNAHVEKLRRTASHVDMVAQAGLLHIPSAVDQPLRGLLRALAQAKDNTTAIQAIAAYRKAVGDDHTSTSWTSDLPLNAQVKAPSAGTIVHKAITEKMAATNSNLDVILKSDLFKQGLANLSSVTSVKEYRELLAKLAKTANKKKNILTFSSKGSTIANIQGELSALDGVLVALEAGQIEPYKDQLIFGLRALAGTGNAEQIIFALPKEFESLAPEIPHPTVGPVRILTSQQYSAYQGARKEFQEKLQAKLEPFAGLTPVARNSFATGAQIFSLLGRAVGLFAARIPIIGPLLGNYAATVVPIVITTIGGFIFKTPAPAAMAKAPKLDPQTLVVNLLKSLVGLGESFGLPVYAKLGLILIGTAAVVAIASGALAVGSIGGSILAMFGIAKVAAFTWGGAYMVFTKMAIVASLVDFAYGAARRVSDTPTFEAVALTPVAASNSAPTATADVTSSIDQLTPSAPTTLRSRIGNWYENVDGALPRFIRRPLRLAMMTMGVPAFAAAGSFGYKSLSETGQSAIDTLKNIYAVHPGLAIVAAIGIAAWISWIFIKDTELGKKIRELNPGNILANA